MLESLAYLVSRAWLAFLVGRELGVHGCQSLVFFELGVPC